MGKFKATVQWIERKKIAIYSEFNLLAVMEIHNNSMHSVSQVVFEGFRCCVFNYYFSERPLGESDSFHVASFRGRPEKNLNRFLNYFKNSIVFTL